MIKILKLSIEIINKAIELSDIKKDTVVIDKQAKLAFNLYMELYEKPNFIKGPQSIRPPFIDEKNYQPLSVNFFKEPQRIIYLRRWILKLLPVIDLFSQVGKLPLTRKKEDFEVYLQDVFNKYNSMLEEIHRIIPSKYNLINDWTLKNARNLCDKIIHSIQEYYRGFPAKAFNELKIGLINNLSNAGHFDNIIKLPNFTNELFYKMREGTNHKFSSDEMFHIPMELRGRASTNRYSIPGLPCVYLGSSPLTCWEELNKPDLNTIQTSLFVSNSINYLDLSTPPVVFINNLISKYHNYGTVNMQKIYDEVISYILLWPLMAACSIRVKNIKDTFKPEYIIPQLLLQFIRQSGFIHGVSYFSTKIENYTVDAAELYRNFAFPVKGEAKEGQCPFLKKHFTITDGVPWNLFQMYKNTTFAMPNETKTQVKLEILRGMDIPYTATDFCILETFLINYLLKEQGKEHELIPVPSDIILEPIKREFC
ncbi:hypothetical protein EXW29_09430 [Bacillus toyonensis]|uniref:hypothetical protein n=1 Tax=Bacillus toyonensis TaxID=155322 RepID=UPI001C033372|nr:hypothetical protein [Bacillus toyonensis]QWH88394.1 hypothetical protein EXW29_09430 [Bacillus toyonensis]QWI31569.1 hypothetical protein EXW25_09420 [Bacillus toyonensis]